MNRRAFLSLLISCPILKNLYGLANPQTRLPALGPMLCAVPPRLARQIEDDLDLALHPVRFTPVQYGLGITVPRELLLSDPHRKQLEKIQAYAKRAKMRRDAAMSAAFEGWK